MRVITTAILGLVAIGLGIAIRVVDHGAGSSGNSAASANVLVRFSEDAVDRLVVEKGTRKVVLVKRGGFWFLAEPEKDRVSPEGVAKLLDEINHLTILDTIGAEEGLTPVQMGVKGDRAIRVTISGDPEDGPKFEDTIVLGVEAPRAGALYAQRGDGEAVSVVDGNPREWIEDPVATLRDPRLIGAPMEAVVQLGVRTSAGEVQLQRRVTPPRREWALSEPIQAWASRELLDELLADFAGLTISEVVGGSEGEAEVPNPLPEDAAVLQFRVVGIEQPLTVYLRQVEAPPVEGAPAVLEARVSDRPLSYRLESTILSKLPKGADDLRDRTLARIPVAYLDSITIESRIDPYVFLKATPGEEGPTWEVKVNNKMLAANNAEVANLVNGVNEAAILDFASDTSEHLADFGLLPPARRLTFLLRFPGQPGEDGTPGPVQEVRRVLNLGWKEGDEQRLYANFEGEPFVYELDPSFVTLIPTHPIKWRSLQVLTFNAFHLRSITREIPGRETLKLGYEYRRDDWEASRNGVDVTGTLNQEAAGRLRDRLGSLTAQGWYLSLASAYEALQAPSAQFRIVTSELDRATGDATEKTYTLVFAKSAANVYFGQITESDNVLSEQSPDVFYIDHETYGDLIRPVTSARANR